MLVWFVEIAFESRGCLYLGLPCFAHTSTHREPRESFMVEGLFALSIRSRCELSGRGDKNSKRGEGDRTRKKETQSKEREKERKKDRQMKEWS